MQYVWLHAIIFFRVFRDRTISACVFFQSTPSRNTHKVREHTPTLVQERAITLTDRDMRENGATVW